MSLSHALLTYILHGCIKIAYILLPHKKMKRDREKEEEEEKTIKAIGTTKPRYTYTLSFDVVALLLKILHDVICDENALEM